MNCTEFMVELTDLLDDRVDIELRREIEIHLDGCDHCRVVYITTRQTIQIYRDNEVYEFEPTRRAQLHSLIMQRCREERLGRG